MNQYCLRIFGILLFVNILATVNAQTWQQIPDFPSHERDDGVAFVIGNTAYCGTGLTSWWAPTSDFYSLDMSTDSWATIAALPVDEERQYASAFSYGHHAYVFGGVGNVYLNDLWQYDPGTNSWQEVASLADSGRSGCGIFRIDSIAYIIGGKTAANDYSSEVWAYNINSDQWQQKNDLPFGPLWRSGTTVLNGKGYLIFGTNGNSYNQNLYEYDPLLDSWTLLSTFPHNGRSHSSLISINGDLVLLCGFDGNSLYYSDMWRYVFSSSSWQQLDSIPSFGRRGGMCFNNNSNTYYTTGLDQSGNRTKETWKYSYPIGLVENLLFDKIKLYPIPAGNHLTIETADLNLNGELSFKIISSAGKIRFAKKIVNSKTEIDISGLAAGVYFIEFQLRNNHYLKSFTITK